MRIEYQEMIDKDFMREIRLLRNEILKSFKIPNHLLKNNYDDKRGYVKK